MKYNGERFLPEECQGEIFIEHYQRYQFASLFASGKTVLDAACGEGYGSSLLAARAAQVTGLDIDPSAVEDARAKYGDHNLSFLAGSVAALPFENASFDMVVSFETIEHVDIETQEAFLREIKRVLKPCGLLLMSTPNKAVYTDRVAGVNHFHIREFYPGEYRDFLGQSFRSVAFFGQFPDVGYFISAENQRKSVIHEGKRLEECRYLIALCSDTGQDPFPGTDSLSRFDDSMYYFLNAAVHGLEQDVLTTKSEAESFQARLEQSIAGLKEHAASLEATVAQQKQFTGHLEKDIALQKDYILKLEADREEQREYIRKLEQNSREQTEYSAHLESDLRAQKQYIAHLEKDLAEQKQYIAHLESDLEEQKGYIGHLEKDLREQAEYIPHLEGDLEELRQYIRHLEGN